MMLAGKDVRPGKWGDVAQLYDDGEISAIWGKYDGAVYPVLGVRWDGEGNDAGYPVAFGHPQYMVLPDWCACGILREMHERALRVPNDTADLDAICNAMKELAQGVRRNAIQLLVCLYGPSNVGKTQTLTKLIDLLKAAPEAELLGEETAAVDRRVVVRVDGFSVGVGTGGDLGDVVDANLAFFSQFNCDVVFLATRKRSDSLSWQSLLSYALQRNIRIEATEKIRLPGMPSDAQIDADNQTKAVELLSLLNRSVRRS